MLTERIVVTAGHCLAKDLTEKGELRFETSSLWVTQPGADMSTDAIASRVKVGKVILVPGYQNYWIPDKRDRRTQRDDIAFIFLEEPLKTGYTIPIATQEEIKVLKRIGGSITHFGYGLQAENQVDQKPYKLTLKVEDLIDQEFDTNKLLFTREDGRALCPGDSGGPWYSDFNGVTKIVAVTVAAGGCRGALDPRGASLGTLIYPYLELMKLEWDKYLIEEVDIKNARNKMEADKAIAAKELQIKIEAAKLSGTYAQDTSGCHSRGVKAFLQKRTETGWIDVKENDGWVGDSSCAATHPVVPWNILEFEASTEFRWRIFSPGNWEAFTLSFNWAPKIKPIPVVSPTASPIPTAEPTPLTSPTPVNTSAPTATKLGKTITCISGKKIKKVTGSTPKCPAGYKLKK